MTVARSCNYPLIVELITMFAGKTFTPGEVKQADIAMDITFKSVKHVTKLPKSPESI